MKTKEFKEIKLRETSELTKLVDKKKQEIDKMIVQTKAGKEKNLKKVKNLKKEVAQILTIIGQKEILTKEKETESEKTK